MAISYCSEGIKFTLTQKRNHSNWLKAIATKQGRKISNLQYIFVSNEKILEINQTYLKHDYFTDIITFPYDEKEFVSADIFISVDTVRQNAQEYNQSFEDELDRVIVHGLLHLIGFDDTTSELQAKMSQMEDESLQLRKDYFTSQK